MVSVGEIPYASQAFYTASWQTKYCYSNEYRNMSVYWHMFTFLLEHNIGLKNMDFTWKKIYNYMFGVFSCMVQGKDWYGTHTFTAQCTQNKMEHPFCIKEVVQQREQLLRFHSQQHYQLHGHTEFSNKFLHMKKIMLQEKLQKTFKDSKLTQLCFGDVTWTLSLIFNCQMFMYSML